MLTVEQLLRLPQKPLHVRGDHSDPAESFRDTALTALAKVRIYGELLDELLRENPADDDRFDETASLFICAVGDAGEYVEAFRNTRDT